MTSFSTEGLSLIPAYDLHEGSDQPAADAYYYACKASDAHHRRCDVCAPTSGLLCDEGRRLAEVVVRIWNARGAKP